MSQKPNYTVFKVDLTTAGSQRIDLEGDFFLFVTAADSAGAVDLDAQVGVALGTAVDDQIPASINTSIRGLTTRYTLSWGAQAGITAVFLISRVAGQDEGIEADAPPTKQLVTSAIASGLNLAAVDVSTTAVLLCPAAATRQSCTVRNNGFAPIFIGPLGVTAATGFNVEPGETFTLDGTTTAVYAIAASGTQPCRVIEEA